MTNVAVPPLDHLLTCTVLEFLGCRTSHADVRALDHLINSYVHKVPWESVFRILKRKATADTGSCPRLPAEFWRDAIEFGGGGTCFENNYAVMSLLAALGYKGYMTVNDLGAHVANHAAGVVFLDDKKYLVDVSIPIPLALPIDPLIETRRATPLHLFMVRPTAQDRFQISRTRHPIQDIYVLIDEPVSESDFRQVIAHDYGPDGQFLDCVRIVKMMEGVFWRYNQAEKIRTVEGFGTGGRQERVFARETLAQDLGAHFQMNSTKLHAALDHFQVKSPNP